MRTNRPAAAEHLVSRRIEIDAAHRVLKHESKCRNLHGHRYVVEARCYGPLEDEVQGAMVTDFGFLEEEMIATIDARCDHSAIFSVEDPILSIMIGSDPTLRRELDKEGFAERRSAFGKIYVVPFAPTAENLARHWFERLSDRVRAQTEGRARLALVKVWATPNCWAAYGPLAEQDVLERAPVLSSAA